MGGLSSATSPRPTAGNSSTHRSIDLLISRLRKRLREDAREPRYIKTVRSEGYVFCADVSPRESA